MADVDFDEFEDGYAAPAQGRMGRFMHLAGAGCSVALIIGMAIWGYKLAVRDVSGIPVVRALPDPMRIAPAAPGGEETMHQGLSVNAVAAAGTVSPLPETLILAPPEIDLAAEDVPGLTPSDQAAAGDAVVASSSAPAEAEAQVQVAALPVAAAPVEVAPVAAMPATSDSAEVTSPAPVELTADPLAEDETPAEPLSEEDAVAAALASALDADPAAVANDLAAGIGAAITKTPRPPERPATLSAAAAAPTAAVEGVVPLAAVPEVAPDSIVMGTRLVQLGAFDDEPTARAEWAKLQGQFPDLISAKSMVVQPAQSGGRTFFRLRALGFDNEDQARKFCAVLLEQNASCIPVTQK